jgi:prolipoprotein diacylglyceryltransferase
MAIAFTLPGNIPIFTFSLLLGAGASLGLSRLLMFDETGKLLPAGFIVLFSALVGAKLGYASVQPGTDLFQIPISGLSWAGALAGTAVGTIIAALVFHQNIRTLSDQIITLVAALAIASWLGCWIDGCAYGPPASAWYSVPAQDEWGNLTERFPVQVVGALLTISTLIIVDIFRSRIRIPGTSAGLWLTLSGAQFVWLHGLRIDPAPIWQGLRPDVWASWAVLVFGVLYLAFSFLSKARPVLEQTKRLS